MQLFKVAMVPQIKNKGNYETIVQYAQTQQQSYFMSDESLMKDCDTYGHVRQALDNISLHNLVHLDVHVESYNTSKFDARLKDHHSTEYDEKKDIEMDNEVESSVFLFIFDLFTRITTIHSYWHQSIAYLFYMLYCCSFGSQSWILQYFIILLEIQFVHYIAT